MTPRQLTYPLLGLLQGLLTYLWLSYPNPVPTDTLHWTLLFIIQFPLFALQLKLPGKNITIGIGIITILTLVYGALAYHLIDDMLHLNNPEIAASLSLQCALSLFIFYVFYCVIVEENRFAFPYTTLFNEFWQIPIKLFLGSILVSLTSGLCLLAATLFKLLDLPIVDDIVTSQPFRSITPPFFFGIAMCLLQYQTALITKLRSIALVFCKFLYPIFIVICTAFLLIFPFTSSTLSSLWGIIILLGLLHLLLLNGVFQAGQVPSPYPNWFLGVIYLFFVLLSGYTFFTLSFPWNKWQAATTFLSIPLLELIGILILLFYHFGYVVAIFRSKGGWLSLIKPINTYLALGLAILYLFMGVL